MCDASFFAVPPLNQVLHEIMMLQRKRRNTTRGMEWQWRTPSDGVRQKRRPRLKLLVSSSLPFRACAVGRKSRRKKSFGTVLVELCKNESFIRPKSLFLSYSWLGSSRTAKSLPAGESSTATRNDCRQIRVYCAIMSIVFVLLANWISNFRPSEWV